MQTPPETLMLSVSETVSYPSFPFFYKETYVNIFVRVKAAGKRRDMLERQSRVVPGDPVSLKEGDTLTFIRLVMLAGRRW
jgi:hypothetical protein